MKSLNINIPAKSLSYLLVCSATIVMIVLIGIVQLYRYNTNRSYEIKNLKNQIEAQKELGPIYVALQKYIENKDDRVLPNPKRNTISREEASKFQNVFRTIAGKSGLMTISLTPDLSSLAGSSKFLLHNAVVKGEFSNFRKMLIALGAVPFMDRIEDIRIQQHSDSMEFRLKIWIALSR